MTDQEARQIVADHLDGITVGRVGARAQFQALISTLPVRHVQDLAAWAGITATTPMDGWVFVECLRNLANRYDKRSFINVAEGVRRAIEEERMPDSVAHLLMVADHEAGRLLSP